MDGNLYNTFTNLEEDLRLKFESIRDILHNDVRHKIEYEKTKLQELYEDMKTAYENKSYLLLWQEFHVRKNFVRAKDAMEERTLSVMAHSYQEFAYKTEARITQLAARNGSEYLYSKDVRTALFLNVENTIEARIDLSVRALQNFTELYNAYVTGEPIFRYIYNGESFTRNSHITPRPLLKSSLTHNEMAINMTARMPEDILRYKNALLEYLDFAKQVYENNSFGIETNIIHDLNVMFLTAGRYFYHSKSVFYSECVEYPMKFLLDKHSDLNTKWRLFEDRFDSIHNKIFSLLSDLDTTQSTTLSTLQWIVNLGHNFSTNLNVTKLEIANSIISEKTLESISNLKIFMSKIRLRAQDIFDEWIPLISTSKEVLSLVLGDENLEEFYLDKNMTKYLRDYDEVAENVTEMYTRVRDQSDFRQVLENQDSLFLDSLQKMIVHMTAYHDTCQLDTNFIKDNFLKLDLFYREKSYEQITQQRAYDMFALCCDIGGSMGLFVGASCLTLYEILDFGVHQCLLRLFKRLFR